MQLLVLRFAAHTTFSYSSTVCRHWSLSGIHWTSSRRGNRSCYWWLSNSWHSRRVSIQSSTENLHHCKCYSRGRLYQSSGTWYTKYWTFFRHIHLWWTQGNLLNEYFIPKQRATGVDRTACMLFIAAITVRRIWHRRRAPAIWRVGCHLHCRIKKPECLR